MRLLALGFTALCSGFLAGLPLCALRDGNTALALTWLPLVIPAAFGAAWIAEELKDL